MNKYIKPEIDIFDIEQESIIATSTLKINDDEDQMLEDGDQWS